jgi:hypothetical protein
MFLAIAMLVDFVVEFLLVCPSANGGRNPDGICGSWPIIHLVPCYLWPLTGWISLQLINPGVNVCPQIGGFEPIQVVSRSSGSWTFSNLEPDLTFGLVNSTNIEPDFQCLVQFNLKSASVGFAYRVL